MPFTDADGEAAGVVVLAPGSGTIAILTRAIPPGDAAWAAVLERDGQRTRIGDLVRGADPAGGAVAWWIGGLGEELPVDTGRAGDVILVLPQDAIGGEPLLDARF